MEFAILQEDPFMNFDISLVSFKNLGLVDLGFEVSKSKKIILKGLRSLPKLHVGRVLRPF